jgi:ADP-ribose pyrophosphatase
VVGRRTIHTGRRFSFEMLRVRRPSGEEMDREVVRHPGAVTVVPVLGDGRVVLIRNFRVAVGEWLWECCAGALEAGESPAACAERELVEETGYEAKTITPIGWFYTTPGLTDERMHAFVATGLTHVGQRLEADEAIQVRWLRTGRILKMIEKGELRDGKSIAAILMARGRGLLDGSGSRGGR